MGEPEGWLGWRGGGVLGGWIVEEAHEGGAHAGELGGVAGLLEDGVVGSLDCGVEAGLRGLRVWMAGPGARVGHREGRGG